MASMLSGVKSDPAPGYPLPAWVIDALAIHAALQPSYRPLTKFENRGLRLGHGVWDLVFEKA